VPANGGSMATAPGAGRRRAATEAPSIRGELRGGVGGSPLLLLWRGTAHPSLSSGGAPLLPKAAADGGCGSKARWRTARRQLLPPRAAPTLSCSLATERDAGPVDPGRERRSTLAVAEDSSSSSSSGKGRRCLPFVL
jgi:hypothetical protein